VGPFVSFWPVSIVSFISFWPSFILAVIYFRSPFIPALFSSVPAQTPSFLGWHLWLFLLIWTSLISVFLFNLLAQLRASKEDPFLVWNQHSNSPIQKFYWIPFLTPVVSYYWPDIGLGLIIEFLCCLMFITTNNYNTDYSTESIYN
jgi:hypothetical protein